MYDHGNGPPLVVIPGIQGRWEWLRPALDALGRRCRTISYTLAGDFGAETPYDPALGFDSYIRQLDAVFERTGLERAALCGISYGGFIALRYAATRPERVSSLVIASSPAPGWVPSEQQQRYVARPWRSAPAFVMTAPMRLYPEICAAHETWGSRLRFAVTHSLRVIAAPLIPSVMAARVTVQQAIDFAPDCARVQAPTLVITGEESLDRIVPVPITRRYESLIPGARYEMIEATGHLGVLTRPERFAELVAGFVAAGASSTIDDCRMTVDD
jgi:pimeloyl-ACP methyl ester carboxylesterase